MRTWAGMICAAVIVAVAGLESIRLLDKPGTGPAGERKAAARIGRDLYGFTGQYPKECLEPVAPPEYGGLVASFDRGRVAISNLDGKEIGAIRHTRLPISFSPDGRLIGAGPRGHLWRAGGEHYSDGEFHSLVRSTGKKTEWSWSPISNCLLHIFPARWGRLAVTVAGVQRDPDVHRAGEPPLDLAPRVLIEAGVRSFAIAPDGRSIAIWRVTHEHEAIYIADLERSVMREVRRLPPETCCLAFAGWSPDGQRVLYWARPGRASPGRGWMLEGVGVDGKNRKYAPLMFPDPTFVERCGRDLFAIVGGGPPDLAKRKLALLRAGRAPNHIGQNRGLHAWPACAPDGKQIAFVTVGRSALSSPRLAIVGEGRLNFLNVGGSPQWLEWAEDGILFALPADDTCFLTVLRSDERLTRLPQPVSCLDLTKTQAFDWSSTPPDGLPVRRSRVGA